VRALFGTVGVCSGVCALWELFLALLVFVAESALCESSCWHCWCLKQSLRSVRALFGTVGVCSGVCALWELLLALLLFEAESALCGSSFWHRWCL